MMESINWLLVTGNMLDSEAANKLVDVGIHRSRRQDDVFRFAKLLVAAPMFWGVTSFAGIVAAYRVSAIE